LLFIPIKTYNVHPQRAWHLPCQRGKAGQRRVNWNLVFRILSLPTCLVPGFKDVRELVLGKYTHEYGIFHKISITKDPLVAQWACVGLARQ
jgi:hypothetical protein